MDSLLITSGVLFLAGVITAAIWWGFQKFVLYACCTGAFNFLATFLPDPPWAIGQEPGVAAKWTMILVVYLFALLAIIAAAAVVMRFRRPIFAVLIWINRKFVAAVSWLSLIMLTDAKGNGWPPDWMIRGLWRASGGSKSVKSRKTIAKRVRFIKPKRAANDNRQRRTMPVEFTPVRKAA